MPKQSSLACSLLASALMIIACNTTTSNDESLVVTADDPLLKAAVLDERGVWSSAPLQDSRWIPFGPGAEVQIEHGLGRVPTLVLSYISYTGDDRKDSEPRVFMPAAGDLANMVEVNESIVTLKNRSRGKNFFVRVVLQ